MKKYEFTGVTKEIKTDIRDFDVYEIRALIDISNSGVKAGDVGGFLLTEKNLSHEGDCWVFPGSVVTHDVTIMEDAVVKGKSLIRNGVILRGNCTIEHSHLAHDITVDLSSSVVNSSLRYGCTLDVADVENSKISSLHIGQGRVLNSTIMVMGSILHATGYTFFNEVDIKIQVKEDSFIKNGGHFERMIAKDLIRFHVHEETEISDAEFTGETHLKFGEPGDNKQRKSVIQGKNAILENLNLNLVNSEVIGEVTLKGYMRLKNTQIMDMAVVINESHALLHLKQIKMDELSKIHKKENQPTTLKDMWLTADNLYSC